MIKHTVQAGLLFTNKSLILPPVCFFFSILCHLVQMSSIRHQIRKSGVGLANPEPESS